MLQLLKSSAELRYAAKRHYAECRSAKCHHAECRGAVKSCLSTASNGIFLSEKEL
jgi:hypothetical protein